MILVAIEISRHHIFAGHAVVIHQGLLPTTAVFLGRLEELHSYTSPDLVLCAPADHDLAVAKAEQVMTSQCMAVDQRVIQHDALPLLILRTFRRRQVKAKLRAMHGLNRRHVGTTTAEHTPAHLPCPEQFLGVHRMPRDPLLLPAIHRGRQAHHTFATTEQDVLWLIRRSGHHIKIMRQMHRVVHHAGFPFRPGVLRLVIGQHAHSGPLAVFVAAPVQGRDDERIRAIQPTHPFHAMHRGLAMQGDGLPLLRAVRRWDQVMDRATVLRIAGIPLRPYRDLALAIAVDVARGDADMVFGRQRLGHDVFFPRRVFIPNDQPLVREQDVRLAISIHIGQRCAVANLHLVIDEFFFEGSGLGVGWEAAEEQKGKEARGGIHALILHYRQTPGEVASIALWRQKPPIVFTMSLLFSLLAARAGPMVGNVSESNRHACLRLPPAILLDNRAATLMAEGKVDEALQAAVEAVASARKAVAQDSRFQPLLVEALRQLAEIQQALSDTTGATTTYREAVSLAEDAGLGGAHQAPMRVALATLLDFNDQEAEALPIYEKAIEELEALEPPDMETAGQLRNNVALTYKRQGKFALAEQHYLRAVEALEKTTGNETVEYAALYNNLGSLYYAAGFADQAGEVFETALALRRKLLGETHPDIAQSHCNMAAVQHELSNDAAAQKSFETALDILEQHLPEKAASYAATGEDYIGLLGSLGEDAKAAAFQKRLFQVLEQKLPTWPKYQTRPRCAPAHARSHRRWWSFAARHSIGRAAQRVSAPGRSCP